MPLAKLPEDFPEPEPLPKRFWEDERWINEHAMDLVRRYPDQWIAVLNREVVAAGKHLRTVQELGRQKACEVGRGQCVYDFVEAKVRFYAGPASL